MSLSKKQRHDYLHSMGIQPWSERALIQKKTNAPFVVDKKSPPIKLNNPLVAQTVKTPSLAKTSIKTEAHVEFDKKDVAKFNLVFLVFNDLLMISELPLHDNATITSAQLKLLKSIRLSLGYPVSEPVQTLMMSWPLIDNHKFDQGEPAAFVAVQAQLKKQIQTYKPKYLVLMGAVSCRYVLGSTISFDQMRGQLIANEELCAAITYGVNELLKVPSLKPLAWQDLQVIRQTLK